MKLKTSTSFESLSFIFGAPAIKYISCDDFVLSGDLRMHLKIWF